MVSEYKTLDLGIEDRIGTLTINRNQKPNTLNKQMLTDIYNVSLELANLVTNNKLKALIITGNQNGFLAGLDLKELLQEYDEYDDYLEKGRNGMRNIENIRIPTIAAVNKYAIGGGLELALTCDFIYSHREAKFGFPEVKLGLMPGAGGTVLLPKLVGLNNAKKMIYTGEIISGEQAYHIGLVYGLGEENGLIDWVKNDIALMIQNPVTALGSVKRAILGEDYKIEEEEFDHLRKNPEVKESIKNYLRTMKK